jgi:hypothetical protein
MDFPWSGASAGPQGGAPAACQLQAPWRQETTGATATPHLATFLPPGRGRLATLATSPPTSGHSTQLQSPHDLAASADTHPHNCRCNPMAGSAFRVTLSQLPNYTSIAQTEAKSAPPPPPRDTDPFQEQLQRCFSLGTPSCGAPGGHRHPSVRPPNHLRISGYGASQVHEPGLGSDAGHHLGVPARAPLNPQPQKGGSQQMLKRKCKDGCAVDMQRCRSICLPRSWALHVEALASTCLPAAAIALCPLFPRHI